MPFMSCDCGEDNIIFEERVVLKRVSKLLTGEPEDRKIPLGVLICSACGKVPKFSWEKIDGKYEFPEELKAKGKINLA